MSTNNNLQPKIYFENASHHLWWRLLSRFIDFMVLIILVFIGLCIILNAQLGLLFQQLNSFVISFWQLMLLVIYIVTVNFLYFVLLPFLWNGQTLGKKISKLKIVYANDDDVILENKKLTFMCYFKRELFITLLPNFIFLIAPLIHLIFFTTSHISWTQYVQDLINNNNKNWGLVIVSGLYIGFISLTVINFAWVIFSKTKRGIYERYSKTWVIKLSDQPFQEVKSMSLKQFSQRASTLDSTSTSNLEYFPGAFTQEQKKDIDELINDNNS